MFAREAAIIRPFAHLAVDLRRDHHILAARHFLKQFTRHLFADPLRIDIGGVKKVDAGVQRPFDKGAAFVDPQHPIAPLWIAIGHHPQTKARHLQPSFP